ncbi:uro-adherence factor A [Parasteatoda tepidariorum]|uniref:uro-adherence factor A n=1 Tax=Parasteatoda tepidariorum TaxID=114398 RepID=UPI0039BD7649
MKGFREFPPYVTQMRCDVNEQQQQQQIKEKLWSLHGRAASLAKCCAKRGGSGFESHSGSIFVLSFLLCYLSFYLTKVYKPKLRAQACKYEKFSSDSAVSQKEKGQLETVSDNHPAELPRKEIKINIALKQPSKNNIQSLNASQPTVSGHLSNANLRDLEIISKDSSAIQLVTESETLQKEGDNSDSENILINETLKVHKSISDGLEFSAHSEVTKNDSSIMKISNESELLQEKDDSSDSENTLANKTLLNQTGHESTASVGLGFLAHSEVSRNDSSVTQLVNEPKTLQKDDNSVTQIVNESETLQKDDSSISENVSTNETQTGLESIVSAGLDFLAQSEVAKNAAVAMEIFNLSDSSLTDHIIDDSVIDLVLSAQNKLDAETASSEIEDIKNDLIPNNEINESHVNTDETESDINLLPIDKKKCPTPGICVFWFMARNACTNDGECLGSKICCRVRCSKKCIDV